MFGATYKAYDRGVTQPSVSVEKDTVVLIESLRRSIALLCPSNALLSLVSKNERFREDEEGLQSRGARFKASISADVSSPFHFPSRHV